jgi:hypothetical protein
VGKGKFDDDERTMITESPRDTEDRGPSGAPRERMFQRSLSEDDIEKFMPTTGEQHVPQPLRQTARPSSRSVEPARPSSRSVNPARPSSRSVEPARPSSRSVDPRPSSPARDFPHASADDEESTQIFQGAKALAFRAAVRPSAAPAPEVRKKNTLLSPAPGFNFDDSSEAPSVTADDGGDPTLIAESAVTHAPVQHTPVVPAMEMRRSAPPPAFARRPAIEPAPVPEPAPSLSNSGSLAVAVSANPLPASRASRTVMARVDGAESKRSMAPWALALWYSSLAEARL